MALNLVTDRTAGAKYNISDLNRVESTVQVLADALNAVGFNLDLTIKTNWVITDNPTQSDMERYRTNVSAIRAALTVLESTPAVPDSMRYLGFESANNTEQILLDVEDALNRVAPSWWYAGEIYSGEV